MTTLFGISMDTIMHVLVAVFAAITAALALLAVRNRLFLKLGLRNIPRRRAQSMLIVGGLMLSTVIITSAFAAGDTFSYSLRTSAVTNLGSVDEIVGKKPRARDRGAAAGATSFLPAATVERVREAVAGTHAVDGVTGALVVTSPLQDLTSRQTKAAVDLTGVPAAYPSSFGPLSSTTGGAEVTLGQLGPAQVYLNQEAATALDAQAGDRLVLYAAGHPHALTVRAVVKNTGLAGGGLLSGGIRTDPVVLMPLAEAQILTGQGGRVTHVLISNRGDALSGVSHTAAVDRALKGAGLPHANLKHDQLQIADKAGTEFTAGFLAFGLFSITAGVMLIVLIFVMLAAERRTEMGVARAVGTKRRHLVEQLLFEGYAYDLAAALAGVAVGVLVGLGIVSVLTVLAQNIGFFTLQRHIEPRSVAVAFCLGALVTFITVVCSAWYVSRLNIVAAIRDLPEDLGDGRGVREAFSAPFQDLGKVPPRLRAGQPLSALFALVAAPWHLITAFRVFISRGPLPIVAGLLLYSLGSSSRQLFPFDLGISLMLVGGALTLRWIMGGLHVSDRLRNRVPFTLAGVALVVFWLLPFDFFRSDLQFGIEMYVLTGIMLTLGGVWTVMYNVDLLLGWVLALGANVGRLAPILRTALTYPMQHRFRTGMTLFMFSLVILALTVQSTLTSSFSGLPLDLNRQFGGYDMVGVTSGSNAIHNISAQVAKNPTLRGRIAAAGAVGQLDVQLRNPGNDWADHSANVATDAYLRSTYFILHSRASGFSSDAQVWQTVRTHPGYAVVDADVVADSGNVRGFQLKGLSYKQTSFAPVHVDMRDARNGTVMHLTVIGVLDSSMIADPVPDGLYVSQATLRAAHDAPPVANVDYFRVKPGQNVHGAALAVGSAFLRNGLDLTEVRAQYDKNNSLAVGFNNLLAAFMALGLAVGIAALGVIATRSVVERRQQIGMLRAIGFQRRMVQGTFLLESSLVAILGGALGIGLGLLLSRQLVDYFAKTSAGLQLVVPWTEVGLILLGTYLASLLTTYLPAWQASRVEPAEALRYE